MTNDENDSKPEPVIFPRITADMTKAEIVDHLVEMHGFRSLHGYHLSKNIKVTKDDLIEFHNEQHEVLEHPDARFVQNGGFVDQNTGRYLGVRIIQDPAHGARQANVPVIDHRHETIMSEISAEDLDMAAKARRNEPVSDKPLNAAQRKVLKELVDNDFNALKSEAEQFAADALEARFAELEADWADAQEKVPGLTDEYRELRTAQKKELADLEERHEKARQKLRDKAGRSGIALKEGYGGDIQGEITGLNDAKKQAKAQNQAMLDRAKMTIERQRLTAQRRVLISGVDSESAKILDEIPDAQTLMVESQRQQAEIASKATSKD